MYTEKLYNSQKKNKMTITQKIFSSLSAIHIFNKY